VLVGRMPECSLQGFSAEIAKGLRTPLLPGRRESQAACHSPYHWDAVTFP
jgi:hypothetical protein